MRTTLIPIDGSEVAMRAVERYADLVRDLPRAQAILLNVEPTLPFLDRLASGTPGEVRRFEEPLRDKAEQILAPAKEVLERAGVQVFVAVEFGDPADVIVARAKDWRADLIVIGTARRGTISGLLPGSVAHKVLHHSELPVLLVK